MDPFSPEYSRFPRDSRHVYGYRFQVEKPDRDWLWTLAAIAVCALSVLVMASKL